MIRHCELKAPKSLQRVWDVLRKLIMRLGEIGM